MAYSQEPKQSLVDEMLSHLHSTYSDFEPSSQVGNFYKNRSVFVTGATGFIGKALVEKLVRTCTGIKRIYLLVREKRGKDISERLAELLQANVFSRIKAHPGGKELLEEKLRVVKGDITLPGFGISADDMEELASEVSIVFNSAATIRFVEPIDVAVRNNIFSVGELVRFCDKLENLHALVHLSTAYSNCHKRDTIYEIFYEPPMRGERIINGLEQLKQLAGDIHKYPKPSEASSGSDKKSDNHSDDEQHEPERNACEQQVFFDQQQEPDLVGAEKLLEEFTRISLTSSNRPNTYTFTKAISESHLLDLVSARPERYLNDKIPVGVVRPSIVGGAWREPDVGHVDNYNGPTGAVLSMYTGALQAMPGNGDCVADLVPVDMVVNFVLCAAWFLVANRHQPQANNSARTSDAKLEQRKSGGGKAATGGSGTGSGGTRPVKPDKGVYIFNFVSGYRNPLRWNLVTDTILEVAYKYPSKYLMRLPNAYFFPPGKLYSVYDWLNHKLVAALQDFVSVHLLRRQLSPRSSALVGYSRVRQMTETLTPFTSNQWTLCDANVCSLYEQLTPTDRQLFAFDVTQIEWPKYLRNYIIGARLYTLRDEAKNVLAAARNLRWRQTMHRSVLVLLVVLFYCLMCRHSQLEAALLGALADGWALL